MRMLGYCDSCHRFKQVKVTSTGMAMVMVTRVVHGVCFESEEKQDADRRGKR